MRRKLWLVCVLASLGTALSARAQQSPFLPEETYIKLVNEISGDIAFDNLRSLVMYHAHQRRRRKISKRKLGGFWSGPRVTASRTCNTFLCPLGTLRQKPLTRTGHSREVNCGCWSRR